MRILYGVTGEGMGHATRSRVVCEHLIAEGHKVKIVVSGRAHAFLAKSFADVVEIRGLSIRYVENAMDRDGSLARNVIAAPQMLYENIGAYLDNVVAFKPHAVMTDFDSFAHVFAKRHRLPILSIDNQQIIARCKHDDALKKGAKVDYQLTKAFVKAKVPGCDAYIVTTFFYPDIRKKYAGSTTLVPPILRSAILKAKAHARLGEHVLVYQTSESDSQLIAQLNRVKGERFIVYGLRRNEVVGNCQLREFSEDGFVNDLASARAVVSNGGLSLIGEALYLGKPIYSVPVHHQYEQLMNARYLEALGFGVAAKVVDARTLSDFLMSAPAIQERLKRHSQDGNALLFQAVDSLLKRFANERRHRES